MEQWWNCLEWQGRAAIAVVGLAAFCFMFFTSLVFWMDNPDPWDRKRKPRWMKVTGWGSPIVAACFVLYLLIVGLYQMITCL